MIGSGRQRYAPVYVGDVAEALARFAPGSVSVLIVSAGERALLCGDAWLHPAQVTEPELPSAFDMDAELAAGTRRTLAERVEAEGMTIGVCHFPAPFGQLVPLEGRRHWIPL